MPLEVVCGCGNRLRVEEEHAGQTMDCPACGQPLALTGRKVPAFDVFISYSSKDKPIADAAVAVLEQRGLRCWIAPRNIVAGREWSESIIGGIEASRLLVLIYSEYSNRSQQVVREIERAVAKGLPIIPFRIEDIPASKAMEYFISCHHWLDAYQPPLEQHLDKLASMAQHLLDEGATDASERETTQSISRKVLEATSTLLSRDKRSRVFIAATALVLVAALVVGLSALATRDPVASQDVIQAKAAAESLAADVAAYDPGEGFDKLQQEMRKALNEGQSLFADQQFAKAGAAFQRAIDAANTLRDWETKRSGSLAEKQLMDAAASEAAAAGAERAAKADWSRALQHRAEADRLYAATDFPAAAEQWKQAMAAYREATTIAEQSNVPRLKAAAFWLGYAVHNAILYQQNSPQSRPRAPAPLLNDPWARDRQVATDRPPDKETVDEGLSVIEGVCREELGLDENLVRRFVSAEGNAALNTLSRQLEGQFNALHEEEVETAFLLGYNFALLRALVLWAEAGAQPPEPALVGKTFEKTLERAYQIGCGTEFVQALYDLRTTWDTGLLRVYSRMQPQVEKIQRSFFANVDILAEYLATSTPAQPPAPLPPDVAAAVEAFDNTDWRIGLDWSQSPPMPRSAMYAPRFLNRAAAPLDETTIVGLLKLDTLKILNFNHSPVTSEQLQRLSALPAIEQLRFEGNITDEQVAELRHFSKLNRLVLKGTEITDAAAEALADLPHLKTLSIYDNVKVTKEGEEAFGKLPQLEKFEFLPHGLRRPNFEYPEDYW